MTSNQFSRRKLTTVIRTTLLEHSHAKGEFRVGDRYFPFAVKIDEVDSLGIYAGSKSPLLIGVTTALLGATIPPKAIP